ncbi:hypothetical protein [Nostoc sp. UHCC 0251]|uniref:hypothetical protein n=1 Tax=Nostoc sp. UHCC 0251 TaxID=3110240 RepID=UPI002B1F9212|nr:hypothetical protein [Nostoc sp. UHCC 0251]MEA5624281.1 hypothetical protein [Nostoc sp. UHCC 0251]
MLKNISNMTQINKELYTQMKREKHNVEELIKKTKLAEKKAEYKQILLGLKSSKYPLLKNDVVMHESLMNREAISVSFKSKALYESNSPCLQKQLPP